MKMFTWMLMGIAFTLTHSLMGQVRESIDFFEENLEPGGTGNIGIAVYDVDHNDYKDIVTVAPDENLLLWYQSSFDSSTWTLSYQKRVIDEDLDGQYLDVEDINGDLIPEIVCSEPGNDGRIILFWGAGTPDSLYWIRDTVVPDFPGAHQVHLIDMDADGDHDILAAGNIANMICWWENNQDTLWVPHLIGTDVTGVQSIAAFDFNQDGYPDVVGGEMLQSSGEVNVWMSQFQDSLVFEKVTLDTQLRGTHWFHVADINGDGLMDILTAAYFSMKIAAWVRADSNTMEFIRETPVQSVDFPLHVAAADLDMDGDMDLMVPERSGVNHKLVYYDNDNGTFIKHIIREYYNAPWQMVPFDADNDHDTDFVAGAFYIPNPVVSGDLTLFLNEISTGFTINNPMHRDIEVSIFPNPCHDHLTLSFHLEEPTMVSIDVLDARGKKQISIHRYAKRGPNMIQLNLSMLKPGPYILLLAIDEQDIFRKIVIFDN